MATGSGANIRVDRIGEGNDPSQDIQLDSIPFDKLVVFDAADGAVNFAAVPIAGLPRGDVILIGGHLHLDALKVGASSAQIIDAFVLSYALGTIATVNNSLADATDFDIKTAVTLAAATGGVSPHSEGVLNGAAVLASGGTTNYIDNSAANRAVVLSMTLPDASIGVGVNRTLRVKGLIKLATIGFGKNR